MKGYVRKKSGGLDLWVHESIEASVADAKLADLVKGLFTENRKERFIKQTSFKAIFKTEFCGRSCLIKRYKSVKLSKRIKSFFRSSGSENEFMAANFILESGIPTPQPLLFAEIKKLGMVLESLIVISFLEGAQDLKDLLFNNNFSSFSEKNQFFYDFGKLTQKIFESRIYQDDYSINNFMIRSEKGSSRLFFIDFEKVKTGSDIPEDKAVWLLAKLNRLGRVVSLTDRIRFLKGYLGGQAEDLKGIKTLALKIQKETLTVLKRDFKRGRQTSPYTCNTYSPLRKGPLKGHFLKGYDISEIEKLEEIIVDNSRPFPVSLKSNGSEKELLVFKLDGQNAGKAWSVLSNLIIAGLKADLPDFLAQGDGSGIIAFETANHEALKKAVALELKKKSFLTDNFKSELEFLNGLLGLG